MPALALSRVGARVVESGPGGEDLAPSAWQRLEALPDPRSPQGRIYPLACPAGSLHASRPCRRVLDRRASSAGAATPGQRTVRGPAGHAYARHFAVRRGLYLCGRFSLRSSETGHATS